MSKNIQIHTLLIRSVFKEIGYSETLAKYSVYTFLLKNIFIF